MESPEFTAEVPVLCQEWVDAFAKAANEGPSAERIAEVEPNYWNWIEARKSDLNVTVAFVLTGWRDEIERAALLRFERGVIRDASVVGAADVDRADLVLGGGAGDWEELIHGPRSLSQNIMYRRLRLYRGDLHLFFRNIYFFVETIRAGLQADKAVS